MILVYLKNTQIKFRVESRIVEVRLHKPSLIAQQTRYANLARKPRTEKYTRQRIGHDRQTAKKKIYLRTLQWRSIPERANRFVEQYVCGVTIWFPECTFVWKIGFAGVNAGLDGGKLYVGLIYVFVFFELFDDVRVI